MSSPPNLSPGTSCPAAGYWARSYRRDFRIERSYRLAFLAQFGGSFTTLLSAGFLSRLVPGDEHSLARYGGDYFTFVLVGTATLSYFTVALGGFSDSLNQEQEQGTLEALLASPTDPRLLLLFGAAWPFLFATMQLAILLTAGGILFHAKILSSHLLLAAGILVLTVTAFSAIGLAASSLMIITKRTAPVLSLIAAAFGLLGGVLYPISAPPRASADRGRGAPDEPRPRRLTSIPGGPPRYECDRGRRPRARGIQPDPGADRPAELSLVRRPGAESGTLSHY